ncbi:MAG: hypothetical protein AB1606_04600 [Nitrospirota bacterium]
MGKGKSKQHKKTSELLPKKERESARKDKPFTHAKGVTASGWINPQTGDMHLEDYCRGLLGIVKSFMQILSGASFSMVFIVLN